MRKYILYNPLAGDEHGKERAERLHAMYIGHELIYRDITSISDYREFFSSLNAEDDVIICGGDGTLSRFASELAGFEPENNLFYYAIGSGNDFLRDLDKTNGSEPFRINDYIKNLPSVFVNGEEHKFINGVGYGLDGYVCETGNNIRKKKKKKINYTLLAILAVLFSFKPKTATITADGFTMRYEKVWLSPVMFGRFFGGGMMVSPDRKRTQEGLSLVVVHNCGKLRILTILPTVFTGKHIKFKDNIEIINANEITVRYDSPCTLQIDGETISDVEGFSAKAFAHDTVTV